MMSSFHRGSSIVRRSSLLLCWGKLHRVTSFTAHTYVSDDYVPRPKYPLPGFLTLRNLFPGAALGKLGPIQPKNACHRLSVRIASKQFPLPPVPFLFRLSPFHKNEDRIYKTARLLLCPLSPSLKTCVPSPLIHSKAFESPYLFVALCSLASRSPAPR